VRSNSDSLGPVSTLDYLCFVICYLIIYLAEAETGFFPKFLHLRL
jgi:hypothetical protein